VLLGLKQFGGILHFLELAFFLVELLPESFNFLALLFNLLQDDFDRGLLDPGFPFRVVGSSKKS
jgi:hypothetical protein